MKVVKKNSEDKLIEVVNGIKSNPGGYYALHFNLSLLTEQYRSDYQIKVAVNILNDIFKSEDGLAFGLSDGDIIFLYNGSNRALLEKAIFQLRYLFMDDPLGYSHDGLENEDFCTVYDLEFSWRDFFNACLKKSNYEPTTLKDHDVSTKISTVSGEVRTKLQVMSPTSLAKIISNIQQTDISEALRSQPVCAILPEREPTVIFDENYINISHLSKVINTDVDLLSQPTLFKYLTKTLDKRVLAILKARAKVGDKFAVSLNLNVSSLFSDEFASFDSMLTAQQKASTIVEIQLSDVFEDIPMFMLARETVQKLGYRICLDGLDSIGFKQVDRKSLGFDLAKVQWNTELDKEEGKERKTILSDAVQKCDPKRVILCRCDNEAAVEYGQSIGIVLFQGRYIDSLLDPKKKIIN